jgi:hypothetical protein
MDKSHFPYQLDTALFYGSKGADWIDSLPTIVTALTLLPLIGADNSDSDIFLSNSLQKSSISQKIAIS